MFRITILAVLGLTSLSACASSDPPPPPAADLAEALPLVEPPAATGLRVDRDPVAIAGLCEPSAAVAGPDGTIWVVDDDQEDRIFSWTPGSGAARAHDARGGASESPFKDPEGLDLDDAGRLWVVGSHSISKSGKLGRRAAISRMAWTPEGWKAEATSRRLRPGDGAGELQPLVDALVARCPDCDLGDLVAGEDDGYALNIEGASLFGENELLIGLRAPLVERRAVLFAVDRAALFGSQPLAELLRGAWAVDLGGRGVRDLARAPDGTLLILAGPAPDGPGNGNRAFHEIRQEPLERGFNPRIARGSVGDDAVFLDRCHAFMSCSRTRGSSSE